MPTIWWEVFGVVHVWLVSPWQCVWLHGLNAMTVATASGVGTTGGHNDVVSGYWWAHGTQPTTVMVVSVLVAMVVVCE